MAVLYECIAAELSLIHGEQWTAPWTATLPYYRTEIDVSGGCRPTGDDDLLHDLLLKGVLRGEQPFPSYSSERFVVELYGRPFSLEEDQPETRPSVVYRHPPRLREPYDRVAATLAELGAGETVGKGPIIWNALLQRSTVGLLPTSTGKSLWYQLVSLLTPGTTIVALMQDQVQGLAEQYGIRHVLAWHSAARIGDGSVASVLRVNVGDVRHPELVRTACSELAR